MRTKAGDMSRGPRRLWEYSLRRLIPAGGAVLLMAAWGCHSAFVETTIKNNGPTPIHVIEVDYPSASFGTQTLAARSAYNYRFKIQGSGPAKLSYNDDKGGLHTSTGPALGEGEEGGLTITIDGENHVSWSSALHPRR
jgi:hypothetical protein